MRFAGGSRECLLNFALRNPREYELIMSGLLSRMTKERPNFELMCHRCAEWLGGTAKDYEGLVFAVWSLAHGTAMLRITGIVTEKDRFRFRIGFRKSLEILVENAARLRGI